MQEGCEYALARCHDSALAMQHVLQSMYITLQVCRFQAVIHLNRQHLKPAVGCCAEHSHDMVCVCFLLNSPHVTSAACIDSHRSCNLCFLASLAQSPCPSCFARRIPCDGTAWLHGYITSLILPANTPRWSVGLNMIVHNPADPVTAQTQPKYAREGQLRTDSQTVLLCPCHHHQNQILHAVKCAACTHNLLHLLHVSVSSA